MQLVHKFALGWLATGLMASAALGQTLPPVAPVRPVTDDYFGTKIVDNYRYFENLKDPEVQQWMKAQADYTDAVLAEIPGRAAFLARLRELDASDRGVVTDVRRVPGDRYFYLEHPATQGVAKLYERTGLGGAERLVVDPATIPLTPENQRKGPGVIADFAISEDSRYVAVSLTAGGAERQTELHVINVDTGRETDDVILRVPGGGAVRWLPGNRSFVYVRLQDLPTGAPAVESERKWRTYLHVLGTDPQSDSAIFGYGVVPSIAVNPAQIGLIVTYPTWKYAVGLITDDVSPNSEFYVAPVDSIGKSTSMWQRVAAFSDQVKRVVVHGDDLYVLTFKDASHYKILRTDARHPDLATAEVVVPASGAIIRSMDMAADALYVSQLDGGTRRVLRVPFGPHPAVARVAAAFEGSVLPGDAEPDVPGILLYIFTPTQAGFIGAYDPATNRVSDTHLEPEGPNDNPSSITSAEVKVTSDDGTLVPLTIVYPKQLVLDGSHPALLRGYGAYGQTSAIGLIPTQMAEFERGAVLATCHVRGGGEYGEEWHVAGMKLTKPNTWKDFIACAEYLIAKGYTSPAHLAGEAASAGGILIGRAIEERPELFAAAIAEVPVADMLRFETTPNGVNNTSEFGSTKTPDGFRGLYAMSPYANVMDRVKYPAVLVTTGINDPRVLPWAPAKFAARLEAATASGKPVLLRVDYQSGHGVTSTAEQALESTADMWSFILWQAGDPDFQRRAPPAP